MRPSALLLACLCACSAPARPTDEHTLELIRACSEAQHKEVPATSALPTIAQKTAAMTALRGYMPLYWDERAGKMWLEIARFDADFLYVDSLPAGLGSNDIGLDRGQLGGERVVRFTRNGPRVLLVMQNLAFRAEHGSAAEKRAVQDSFAQSVLAGFDVAAEEGGRVLVDATAFFLRDAHEVAATLKRTGQGEFALDPQRCAFQLASTKNFPKNTDVEVTLTFTGREPGAFVRDVAPDPTALSVRLRHSFVELPGPGFVSRAFDPRAGYSPAGYADYSTPIGEPLQQQFLTRHRLQKKDPSAARSEVVEPIVYYLDPATPEPVRGALLEGARWWSAAFDAAGFVDAFRVELLPEGADAQDVRYNMIQWVHRATRGWSYGVGITDPRTGEIIKGQVTLGSLRVRQDYLIATGLLAPFEDRKPVPDAMERMALARMRQLAAHEVGHTLGLAHNFLASTSGRASVMDYPQPLAQLRADGTIDLDDAYASGIGAWDKVAIEFGYREYAPGTDERAAGNALLERARASGLVFLTDQDARPAGSSHPSVHLWDNGTNAIDELQRMLGVRAAALARFGENVVRPGRPLATIEDVLVPIYLLHRYQIEAVSKSIGGTSYSYALRGDGQVPLAPVAAAEQRRALQALLDALAPANLCLPEKLLARIPPRPEGFPRTRELFENHTGGNFDALAPAEAAAEITFRMLLDPARAARLVEQHARDAQQPGLDFVLGALIETTWHQAAGADAAGEVQRAVDAVALARLVGLAADARATTQVRAVATAQLKQLADWLDGNPARDSAEQDHRLYGARLIKQFLEHPREFAPPPTPATPPGQPIGEEFGCGL